MKVAYLDGMGRLSGEMFLGALLDADLDFELLKGTLESLSLEEVRLKVEQGETRHIQGVRLRIDGECEVNARREINEIIQGAGLSRGAGLRCIRICEDLAAANGAEQLQKGADRATGFARALIMVVGTLFGLESLGVKRISSSWLPEKTMASASSGDAPVDGANPSGVHVTPVAAALARGLVTDSGPLPSLAVERVGYGLGERVQPERTDLLRITIGYDQSELNQDMVSLMEVTLIDTNPEWLGYLMDRLLVAGALDVVYLPVQLNRSQPGIMLQVMSRPQLGDDLRAILDREGISNGIRFHVSRRCFLRRELLDVESPWGKLKVKKVLRPNAAHVFLPEYEACRKVTQTTGLPLQELYRWVLSLNRP
jgi:uncharacterized protein (DUF111 family)